MLNTIASHLVWESHQHLLEGSSVVVKIVVALMELSPPPHQDNWCKSLTLMELPELDQERNHGTLRHRSGAGLDENKVQ